MGNGCVKTQVLPALRINLENISKKPVITTSSHVTLKKANEEWESQNFTRRQKTERNPTCIAKSDIFKASSLHKQDEYAKKSLDDFMKLPSEAIAQLAGKYKKDLKKVRVIFRWMVGSIRKERLISERNTRRLSRSSSGYNSLYNGRGNSVDIPGPSELRTVALNNNTGPARLFCQFCREVGIKSEVILGTVKTRAYQAGNTLDYNGIKREWVAVFIKKEWRLVDVDLASEVAEHLSDFYFLTDPEEFVYDHLPEDSLWQLLASPVSQVEFQEMECLKPQFFQLGLKTQNTECTQHTKYGVAEVTFTLPKDKDLHLKYALKKTCEGQQDQLQQQQRPSDARSMKQCVFLEQQRNNILVCKISLPSAGKYRLVLSAYDRLSESELQSSCICEYLVVCASPKRNWLAVPETPRTIWGPTKRLATLGLEPLSHKQGYIYSNDGRLRIVFKASKKIHVSVHLEDTEENNDHLDLTQWALLRVEHREVLIDLRLIRAGCYALNIHAQLENNNKSRVDLIDLPVVCSYLLRTDSPLIGHLEFPDVMNQKAGATEHAERYGIVPLSHVDSYFKTRDGEIDIILTTEDNVFFKTKLYHCFGNDRDETEGRTMIAREGTKVTFTLCFTKVGLYLFNITAKKASEVTEDVVFNYVIQVTDTQGPKRRAFPKYFAIWGPGCENYGAEDGILATREEVQMWVKVPGATKIVAIQDQQWDDLEQEEAGVWGKRITTSAVSGTELKISACIDRATSESYYTHLQYQVLDRSEIEEVELKEEEEAKSAKDALLEQNHTMSVRENTYYRLEKDLIEFLEKAEFMKLALVLQYLEQERFTGRCEKLYDKGKAMVAAYYNIQTLISSLKTVKRSVISDLQGYKSAAPEAVHLVTRASLLMLGVHEGRTKDWSTCRSFFSLQSLSLSVMSLHQRGLYPEVAARVQEIMASLTHKDIDKLTPGPKCFYTLTSDLLPEVDCLVEGGLDCVKPADIERQRELMGEG